MASKGLAALPRTRGSALAHGCGREGSVALPLPRAAAVSTGLRVRRPRRAYWVISARTWSWLQSVPACHGEG